MSWSSYVDNLVASGAVALAAVCGLEDGGVWAQSPGFNLATNEIKFVIAAFKNPDQARANGIVVGGTKYFCLAAEDSAIQGKKGNAGISIAKSNKCVIIGTYKDGQQPGNCRTSVEKICDYLKSSGY